MYRIINSVIAGLLKEKLPATHVVRDSANSYLESRPVIIHVSFTHNCITLHALIVFPSYFERDEKTIIQCKCINSHIVLSSFGGFYTTTVWGLSFRGATVGENARLEAANFVCVCVFSPRFSGSCRCRVFESSVGRIVSTVTSAACLRSTLFNPYITRYTLMHTQV